MILLLLCRNRTGVLRQDLHSVYSASIVVCCVSLLCMALRMGHHRGVKLQTKHHPRIARKAPPPQPRAHYLQTRAPTMHHAALDARIHKTHGWPTHMGRHHDIKCVYELGGGGGMYLNPRQLEHSHHRTANEMVSAIQLEGQGYGYVVSCFLECWPPLLLSTFL